MLLLGYFRLFFISWFWINLKHRWAFPYFRNRNKKRWLSYPDYFNVHTNWLILRNRLFSCSLNCLLIWYDAVRWLISWLRPCFLFLRSIKTNWGAPQVHLRRESLIKIWKKGSIFSFFLIRKCNDSQESLLLMLLLLRYVCINM